jgi:hypothetical protein
MGTTPNSSYDRPAMSVKTQDNFLQICVQKIGPDIRKNKKARRLKTISGF